MRAPSFAPLAVAAFLAMVAPATDWIVGPAGSGAPFTSIQAAINAAQPGDRVLVFPGLYGGTISITQGVELLGTSSATVLFVSGPGPSGTLMPPIRVANLPAGSRVRIAGMRFDTASSTAVALTYLMQIDQCLGHVELNDVVLRGSALPLVQSGQVGASLHVRNCGQVVLSGVRATGSQPPLAALPGAPGQANGLPGMLIEQSSVWLADCLVEGNAGWTPSSGFGGDGGDGLSR